MGPLRSEELLHGKICLHLSHTECAHSHTQNSPSHRAQLYFHLISVCYPRALWIYNSPFVTAMQGINLQKYIIEARSPQSKIARSTQMSEKGNGKKKHNRSEKRDNTPNFLSTSLSCVFKEDFLNAAVKLRPPAGMQPVSWFCKLSEWESDLVLYVYVEAHGGVRWRAATLFNCSACWYTRPLTRTPF